MTNRKLRIGIVGAGYMGGIRARSAHAHPACSVTLITDPDQSRARKLAEEVGARTAADWGEIVNSNEVDAVAAATPHRFLAPVVVTALRAHKHVFCEKPMARNGAEAEEILSAADALPGASAGANSVRPPAALVGYTLRHHPAVRLAWKWFQEGRIGAPMYLRGRYGHGGRPGYEHEWRMDREMGGGGELLDQGVHLIDLSRAFLGDFSEAVGLTGSFFWGAPKADVEDNAFMLLRTSREQVASLHASWTQWKNLFSFEIFGSEGSVAVEGLGGSYGPERLAFVRRREGKLPDLQEVSFPPEESAAGVWNHEWASFVAAARPGDSDNSSGDLPSATLRDGHSVLQIVGRIYAAQDRKKEGGHASLGPQNAPSTAVFK
jgi:predicted dehydrogenase